MLCWFEGQRGYLISKNTLSRHLQVLAKCGKISISYTTKGQAVYRFPDEGRGFVVSSAGTPP